MNYAPKTECRRRLASPTARTNPVRDRKHYGTKPMLLRDISLYLEPLEYPREYGSNFDFRSRSLCNFIRRQLKKKKVRCSDFGSIAIRGTKTAAGECKIGSTKVLVVDVDFDQSKYDSMEGDSRNEFYIAMLQNGLEVASEQHELPMAEISSAIESFRDGGYRNSWTHKKRHDRKAGLMAKLECRLDQEKFVLELAVVKSGRTVFESEILETEPDEIIFSHRFKDIVFDGDILQITEKSDEILYSLNTGTMTPLVQASDANDEDVINDES